MSQQTVITIKKLLDESGIQYEYIEHEPEASNALLAECGLIPVF